MRKAGSKKSAGDKRRKAEIDRSPNLSNAARFFGGFGPVHVTKDLGGGKFEIIDARDGSVVKRTKGPAGPGGAVLKVFEPQKVRLLQPGATDNGRLKKGAAAYVQMLPGGPLYLFATDWCDRCIKTGVKEGVDFEWTI